ncbi:MAG: hypothetical protein Q7T45_15690 [Bradyrhizobium sp.]|uniref:hypothetical protein n=1 Tax=Bradyrhizobium sp. TaxID=376 RepID=UPI0027285318|nr:hypothetical protein [Bradyrhizobium sp.]MDO8399255.1 hypothetical protein [Bradyrhizobium sp.]
MVSTQPAFACSIDSAIARSGIIAMQQVAARALKQVLNRRPRRDRPTFAAMMKSDMKRSSIKFLARSRSASKKNGMQAFFKTTWK